MKTRNERRSWHLLEDHEAFSQLNTSAEGLSQVQVVEKRREFGPNELVAKEQAVPLVILLHQLQSPLIYLLIAAAILTLVLGKYIDTAVILAVVVLNSVLGFFQEYKAEQSLRALAQFTTPLARVVREGIEMEIPARELVPGDIVLLTSGFRVPADLRLVRTIELKVDEAILTGESLPVTKNTEVVCDLEAPVGDRLCMAFMGSMVVSGRGAGVVVSTGISTEFGQIFDQVRQVGETKSPLQTRMEGFSLQIAYLALAVTALMLVLGIIVGEPLVNLLVTAVATVVAAIPEGLPVTITIALAVGVQRMARRQAIIRKLPVVETLGSCTVICSDKTGTLTRNEMTVTRLAVGGAIFEVSGAGYSPRGEISLGGVPVRLPDHPALELGLRIGLLCNESNVYAQDGKYQVDGDPTEAALIVAAQKGGLREELERETYVQTAEIPFESERQYMATLHRTDSGKQLIFAKGAPEKILGMSQDRLNQDGSTGPLDNEALLAQARDLASSGLRVLALGFASAPASMKELDHHDLEGKLTLVGFQAMIDPPRPEAIEAIANCQRAGIRVAMVTGDHRITAEAISKQMGILSPDRTGSLEGRDVEGMSDEELAKKVGGVSVFARAAPEHKLRVVQQLRRQGEVVAVTGDGVNDAPALKQADIGIAMGITGTDVAKESADMVLVDDNFASIFAAVEEGRVVFANIRKVVIFLLPTGLGMVLTMIAAIVLRLPLPYLPAQAIWINLVTNGLQDVSMAFEPAEGDVTRQKPRSPREGILTRLMIERTAIVGLVLLAGTLGLFWWHLNAGFTLEYARTVAMTTMVLFQNFHVFNSRSLHKSAFSMSPFSNRLLFVSIIAALSIHVVSLYWGPLQFVLRGEPLSLETWGQMIPVAMSVVVVVEVEKALRRWLSERSRGQSIV
jgi:Ca2+-transporting ATPase